MRAAWSFPVIGAAAEHMTWPIPPARLLDGPRGRRLCWELVQYAVSEVPEWSRQDRLWSAARHGDLSGVTGDLAAGAADAAELILADQNEGPILLTALATVTQLAMYWQEPEPEDIALDDQAVGAALLPVAEALAQAPEAAWWATPVDDGSQQLIEWPGAEPPVLAGVPAALASWREAEAEDERDAASRPGDPAAPWSGHWWSIPVLARLPQTARSLPGAGPVGLALVEDSPGWQEARCRPVRPDPAARCYEIDGAESWAGLVARYPFDVSKSRRHDWWRLTGWAGPWLMADFAAVAADYDAVHLTVLGYLTTAGRAVPAGQDDARTVLAGWAPDTTYWLADVLSGAGPATNWVPLDDGPLWTPEIG